MGRDPGIGVDVPVGWDDACFFLCFFRDDSLPLDSERLGEPGRFRLLAFFSGSECFGRPEGVLVPFDDAPEGSFDSILDLALASSSFRLSISACFSSSEVSSSLYVPLAV